MLAAMTCVCTLLAQAAMHTRTEKVLRDIAIGFQDNSSLHWVLHFSTFSEGTRERGVQKISLVLTLTRMTSRSVH